MSFEHAVGFESGHAERLGEPVMGDSGLAVKFYEKRLPCVAPEIRSCEVPARVQAVSQS
jgi:hypothetical protein